MIMVEDTAQLLEQSGAGIVGSTIFCTFSPATPDEIVTLYDYAGLPPDETDPIMRQLSLQVRSRGQYAVAMQKAMQIESVLSNISPYAPIEINHTRYYRFAPLQSPYKLKTDDNGRDIIAQNYRVWARPITTCITT